MVGGVINEAPRLPVYITPQGTVKSSGVAGVTGVGLGVILMTLLDGRPELVQQIVGWGPGIAMVGAFVWMAQKFVPPLLATQQEMTGNIGQLAGAIQANLCRDDDVREAVCSIAAKLDRHHELVLDHIHSGKKQSAT